MSSTIRKTHLDERDQYFLSQELEKFDPTKFYELVSSAKGRQYLPPVSNVSEYDPSYKYAMIHLKGSAKIVGAGANDAPVVKVTRTEHNQSIKAIENTIEYTFDEVGAARSRGIPLESEHEAAAVTATEETIDEILAVGDADAGIPGFLNSAAILETQASDKGSGQRSWLHANADADEILNDVALAISETRAALKDGRVPGTRVPQFDKFTLLVPPDRLTKLATTRLSGINTTILEFILDKMKRWIVAVDDWAHLDTADDGSPMGILFPAIAGGAMNPMCGGAIIPLDFKLEQHQFVGRKVVVPTVGKCGGTVLRYAVGCRRITSL